MIGSNRTMYELQAGGRAQRPASRQHQIVNILQANAGELAKDVERMQQLLNVDKRDVPGAALCLDVSCDVLFDD